MKRVLRLISILLLVLLCFPLSTSARKDKVLDELRTKAASGEIILGTGHGKSLQQAREDALLALSSQISVSVSEEFSWIIDSKTSNGKEEFKEQVKNIVKTYSRNTLRNALEVIERDKKDDAIVHRYIKQTDLDKIFADRKSKALTYAKTAYKYNKEGKVANALRYYYWAMLLLRSCPNGDELTITFGLEGDKILNAYLYDCIKDIINGIEVSVTNNVAEADDTRTLGLYATYKGYPVSDLNYTISEGDHHSAMHIMRNGRDQVNISGTLPLSRLDLRGEYYTDEELNIDTELKDVAEITEKPPLQPFTLHIKGSTPPKDDIQEKIKEIKLSGKNLTGEATGSTETEAHGVALTNLMRSVARYCEKNNVQTVDTSTVEGAVSLLKKPRGEKTWLMLYVPKTIVIDTFPTPVPIDTVPPVIQRICSMDSHSGVTGILEYAYKKGEIKDYGKYKSMSNPDGCYLVMIRRDMSIAGVLSPKVNGVRTNVKDGMAVSRDDMKSLFPDCAPYCVRIK